MKSRVVFILLSLFWVSPIHAQQNLNEVPSDLAFPAMSDGEPAAGKRVRATTSGWEGTQVHHSLYLPVDWKPQGKYPILVEYPGNGRYINELGDSSGGTVEGCMLGYGLSSGKECLWICLPFIEQGENAIRWWGDVAETKRYCEATVSEVCQRFGGDQQRVVLLGFSRGAIACHYIGLHDDNIAKLWRGFFCHSHHDATFKHPAPDRAAWPERLRRLGARPEWISHELGPEAIQTAIEGTGFKGNFTFVMLPYANHSARWVLCDLPIRQQARDWLKKVLE